MQSANVLHTEPLKLDQNDVFEENLKALSFRREALRSSFDESLKIFEFTSAFGERLCGLAEDELNCLAGLEFSLLRLNEGKFVEVKKAFQTIGLSGTLKNPQSEHFVDENRIGLNLRWMASKLSVAESQRIFKMSPDLIKTLYGSTGGQLNEVASLGLPLFKLVCNERILDLAKVAESPQELTRLHVLYGKD